MDAYDLSSTELNEIQNHDDFRVVWISSSDRPNELKKFGSYLNEFVSNETAINYIKQFKSECKILLILTDSESLSDFKDFIQIQSIYILRKESENKEFNKEDHPKLVGIFDEIDELIERLRKDIILTYRNDLSISISSLNEITIEQSLMNIHGNTLMFMWDQLFIYYLIKSPDMDMNMEELKKEMLEQCQLEYKDNQIELNKINEFDKDCSINNIFKWYTKDSFLYRLLNKAFRAQNIELICKFRYFIILLYHKFKDLSKEQPEHPSIVYRGQILSENTIENLKSNVGHLISINTIMSTSRDEEVASFFILGAANAVIFKINLPNQIDKSFKSFIDISKFSVNPDEKEILFFVGAVFSIDSVKQEDNSTWIIELTLHDETSKHIEKLIFDLEKLISNFEKYRNLFGNLHHLFMKTDDYNMIDQYYFILTNEIFSLNNSPTVMMYIRLAFTLSNLGLYKKAIEFYEEAISVGNMSIDSPQSKVLYIIIGYLYYHLSVYDNAFIYYGIALSLLDQTNRLTGELYNHIGNVWFKIQNVNIALSCYKEALKIANNQDIPSLPNIYRNIINILKIEGNFEEAVVYEEQAKEIDQSQYHISESTWGDPALLKKHEYQLNNDENLTLIERADLLCKIGLHLMVRGDFDEALEKLLDADKFVMKEPPSWDRFPRHLPTIFDNIAALYVFRKDYLKALTTWKKAINIRNSFNSH